MTRPELLACLDVLAGKVAALAPTAAIAFIARAPAGDWGVYFNGKPIMMGHDAADLIAADALFDAVQPAGARLFVLGAPYIFTDGARALPIARAGGPVADA